MVKVKTSIRIAVAEELTENVLAPRLGKAFRFALFDVTGKDIRGPFYRVRHDEPGTVCDDHAELTALLHDCKLVIAGSVGPAMEKRLRELGIQVVATPERRPATQLIARHFAGTLERSCS